MNAKDLTKEAPRSPREKIDGYVILARALDKCRATLAGNAGEYHYNCPLDQMLFEFCGVSGEEVKKRVESGASDEEIAAFLGENGSRKTADEVNTWSAEMEATRPYDNPEKREWFEQQCQPLGLDPKATTLFDWLEADDRASY